MPSAMISAYRSRPRYATTEKLRSALRAVLLRAGEPSLRARERRASVARTTVWRPDVVGCAGWLAAPLLIMLGEHERVRLPRALQELPGDPVRLGAILRRQEAIGRVASGRRGTPPSGTGSRSALQDPSPASAGGTPRASGLLLIRRAARRSRGHEVPPDARRAQHWRTPAGSRPMRACSIASTVSGPPRPALRGQADQPSRNSMFSGTARRSARPSLGHLLPSTCCTSRSPASC